MSLVSGTEHLVPLSFPYLRGFTPSRSEARSKTRSRPCNLFAYIYIHRMLMALPTQEARYMLHYSAQRNGQIKGVRALRRPEPLHAREAPEEVEKLRWRKSRRAEAGSRQGFGAGLPEEASCQLPSQPPTTMEIKDWPLARPRLKPRG
jgi:hypothetical protein